MKARLASDYLSKLEILNMSLKLENNGQIAR